MTYLFRLVVVVSALALTGCFSIADINTGYYRVGKAWQLDNQKTEDEYRYRVIESDYLKAFEATRKVFLALNMPVQASSLEDGVLLAENVGPAPLTRSEWLEVKRIETPRLKELGGQLFSFGDDPKEFTITVRAKLKRLDAGRVLVVLDYMMQSPSLKSLGIDVPPHAPPTAVRLAAHKFWQQFEIGLLGQNVAPPRKRTWDKQA